MADELCWWTPKAFAPGRVPPLVILVTPWLFFLVK